VKYPRTPGHFPLPAENPRNAWYVKTAIKGAPTGKLAGKRVAIKDNVMVAGVPMMNGNAILEGYVPDIDATIITRMLDAGAEIAGKTHCENYCISGGSHTNAKGPVHNPYKMGYSSGGSSSGSGVVVALGEVKNGQYQYSIVTTPSGISLWVLARNVDLFMRDYDAEVRTFLEAGEYKYVTIEQDIVRCRNALK
jgi:hypothetical protein